MTTREDHCSAEASPGVSCHDCVECGRATLDGPGRCQHCGYSEAATDRLVIGMAAAFLMLAVAGLVVADRSGAAVQAAVIGLAIIVVTKTSRRRRP